MTNLILTKTIDSKYILERAARDFNESGRKAKQLFIVPDRIAVSYQMMVLEALGLEGSTNIEVMSFRNLADKVLGKKAKQALNQQMETMLLRKVIEDSKKDFVYYQKSAQYPGFAQEAIRLITTLRANRVNPERLDDLIPYLDAKYVNKVKDIKLLLSNYISALDEHVDYISKLEYLKEAIDNYYKNEDKVDFNFFDYDIYVSEFFGFSEIELGILRSLFNNSSKRNYITLPYSEADNRYIFPNYLKEKICDEFVNVNVEEEYKQEKLAHKEYETIQSNLFGYNKVKKENTLSNVIKVQVASNTDSEVKAVVSQIKGLIISNGYRYSDIACICCDMPTYKESIESLFEKYEIPYFTDVKASLMDQNITKILMYALKVKINDNFSQANVFALIKELGDVLASKDALNEYENYCLKKGIDRAYKFKREILDNPEMEKVRVKLLKILEPLNFSEAVTVKDMVGCINEFLKGIDAQKICDDLSEAQKENYGVQSSVTAQSYKKLMEILEQFADEKLIGNCKIGREDNISQATFFKILESTIMSVTITTIPMYIDCVYIGDLQKSRYESKKVIFIFGANEGLFPQEIQDNSLLSMQDLNEWEEKGQLTIYPTVKETNKEAKLNALVSLIKAEERVYISYPLQDADGNLLKPASAIDLLLKIEGKDEATAVDLPSNDWDKDMYKQFVGASSNALEALIAINNRIKNRLLDDEGICKEMRDALYTIASKQIGEENVKDILKGEHIIDGDIEKEPQKENVQISPSRLETYLGCPFRYYMQHILHIQKREEFGVEVSDTGTIVHACFEDYFNHKDKDGKPDYMDLSEDDIAAFITDRFETIIDKNIKFSYLNEPEFKIAKEDLLKETIKSITILVGKMKASEFRPLMLESGFGIGRDDNPPEYDALKINLGEGRTLEVHGIIDRVDVAGKNAVIIDYKSKTVDSAKLSVPDIVYGNKIQIILYLRMLTSQFKDLRPVGAFYLPLSTKVNKSSKDDKVRYVGLVTDDEKVIRQMQTDIDDVYKEVCATKKGNARIATGRLFPIKMIYSKEKQDGLFVDPDTGERLSDENIQTLLKYIDKLAAQAVSEMQDGYIKISPLSDTADKSSKCMFCDYKAICNIEKHPENVRLMPDCGKEVLGAIEEVK